MHTPTVDIIVPVWNSPFEVRACLAAILEHSGDARLIIVDNGSNRETELMLEEFSEPLGERGLFIKSERNLGLMRAINMGLARSDSDCAVIVRHTVKVTAGWLEPLLEASRDERTGIISPLFSGPGAPSLAPVASGCTGLETFSVTFSTLLLKGEMRMLIGCFDENMDGGEWCLRDYVRRAAEYGWRTGVSGRSRVICGKEVSFGSDERRQEMARTSRSAYLERWGDSRVYGVYFPREVEPGILASAVDKILDCARQGHVFIVMLHRRQAADFRRNGWNGLHTGMVLKALPLLFPERHLARLVKSLKAEYPGLLLVRGADGVAFPGGDAAIPFSAIRGNDRPRRSMFARGDGI